MEEDYSAGIERVVRIWFNGFFVLMLLVSVAAGIAAGRGFADGVAVALTAFLLYASSSALGGVIGMLFGMPRSRLADALNEGQTSEAAGPSRPTHRSKYLTNSNFIKVSDWLTTIIIGLGLVNIQNLAPAAGSLRDSLSDPLGGTANAGLIGLGIVVVSFLTGFILAFLWTMIKLKLLLEKVDY
jgi:hypothetical protein